MSNTEIHDDDNERDIPSLRKAAKDGKAALNENAELKRQLLFAKAGIDTDSRLGNMLFKTFEGDDLEVLKNEATELGLIGKIEAPANGTPPAGESQQADFRAGFAPGQAPPQVTPETPDPTDNALRTFHKDMRTGMNRENAQLGAIDRVLVAASNGDKRVIYDPSAPRR